MNTLTAITVALVVMLVTYTVGFSNGKTSVKVSQFKEYQILENKLNATDIELLQAKAERDAARDKKVVKYVTVYRDKIKDPATAECVRNSGLLDVYNMSISTE